MAPSPSGKAEVCKTSITSSNLVGASIETEASLFTGWLFLWLTAMDILSPHIVAILLASGAVAGFCAGLLGIGGGVILVPLFLWCFPLAGFPPEGLVHSAIGTSLGVIVLTACSSALAHRKHGNVDWYQVLYLAMGGACGAILGSTLATYLPGEKLKGVFAVMLILVGLKMFFSKRHLPPERDTPVPVPSLLLVGLVGGGFSAFFGIGGGVVTVPLMVMALGLPIHLAVGNASALIVVSTIFGTASYILHGWNLPSLPAFSLGYVNLLVVALVVPASTLFARLGVRVARHAPHDKLSLIFAMLQLVIGTKILFGVLFG